MFIRYGQFGTSAILLVVCTVIEPSLSQRKVLGLSSSGLIIIPIRTGQCIAQEISVLFMNPFIDINSLSFPTESSCHTSQQCDPHRTAPVAPPACLFSSVHAVL
ncbi:hypothetical protein C8Q75DRAFT_73590 [Abortiporus biennis]|nr:hypothetical protein C8Q75DRAFT_73590 [Abortiporus biennis]